MATDYSKKKNAELEELLKSRSLPHTGKKAELVARLHESDLKRSLTDSSPSLSSKPIVPTPKAPKSVKPAAVNPPANSSSAAAEDEIDWEEDDSSIIPSVTVATTTVNAVQTSGSPTKNPTPSPPSVSNKSPTKSSTTSPITASATPPSITPASTTTSATPLTTRAATAVTISKKNAAIDPSKTRDLTVHYPQASKSATSAPPEPTPSTNTVAAQAAAAPTATATVTASAATESSAESPTETAPPSDVSKSNNPVTKLGDDNTRRNNRMTRFGDGSGAYAAALKAKTQAGETDAPKPEYVDGNADSKEKLETQAETDARKAAERAKKFGVVDKPVRGLDEALPEAGLKRRRNNTEDGGRGGKRFRGNEVFRRDDGFRRGGKRDGGRPGGNRGGNNSRKGGIERSGLSERDRLAAEARKAKFATPS